MNRPEGRISWEALENPESRVRPSPSPPPHSSNPHGQSNFKNQGIRIVHAPRPEGSGPINSAAAMIPGDNVYLPYLSNSLALRIKHASSSRGDGAFTIRNFPANHRVIYEGPIFSCLHPTQTDATSWKMAVIDRWRNLAMIDQRWLRSHFSRIEYMPMGRLMPTAHESMDFLCFVLEYAFSNPRQSRVNIYRLASHINHACHKCANAYICIEPGIPYAITVRLSRKVKKGQEIFINYNRPSGNKFGCAVCGIRDGETSRFKLFWHDVVRLAHGVRSDESAPGLNWARPFPPLSAKTSAHVVALATAETPAAANVPAAVDAPVAVNVPADAVNSASAEAPADAVDSASAEAPADAVDGPQSIMDSATAEASGAAHATTDDKDPTDTVATVVPVGDANAPETHRIPLRRKVWARWASFRARLK